MSFKPCLFLRLNNFFAKNQYFFDNVLKYLYLNIIIFVDYFFWEVLKETYAHIAWFIARSKTQEVIKYAIK